MNKINCIVLTDTAFKDLQTKYNISTTYLEYALQLWQDKSGLLFTEENKLEAELFVREYFKIDSTNTYTNSNDFSNAIKVYNYYRDNGLITPQNYGKLVTLFGEDNVISYKDADNNEVIKVAEPIFDNSAEMQSIKQQAIANGTFMKAPNGNPTNLTEQQWLQVRTKAFKDWFGDWEKTNLPSMSFMPKRHWKIGQRINTPSEAANICDNTQLKVLNKLINTFGKPSTRGQYYAKPVTIWAKSPINDKQINHKVVAVRINGEVYLYDMPQTEFIKEIATNDGEVIKEYSPRLIKYTEENLISEYGTDKELIHMNDESILDTDLLELPLTDASKVVDENGEPLVVYHSDNYEFTGLNREGATFKQMYFSTKPHDSRKTYATFLNIKNPRIEHTDFTDDFSQDYENVEKEVIDKGFDGAIGYNYDYESSKIEDAAELYVINPNQIKSATDNIGAFSKKDDNIYASLQLKNPENVSQEVHNQLRENVNNVKTIKDVNDIIQILAPKFVAGNASFTKFVTSINNNVAILNRGRQERGYTIYKQESVKNTYLRVFDRAKLLGYIPENLTLDFKDSVTNEPTLSTTNSAYAVTVRKMTIEEQMDYSLVKQEIERINSTEDLANLSSDEFLFEKFNGKKVISVNELLSNLTYNEALNPLVTAIQKNIGVLGDIQVGLVDQQTIDRLSIKGAAGIYSPTSNDILISAEANFAGKDGSVDTTILHEIIHAIVSNSSKTPKYRKQLTDLYNQAVADLTKATNRTKEELLKYRLYYGLTNPDEFVAELFTNSGFAKVLNQVGEKSTDNVFNDIINWILNCLGLTRVSKTYVETAKLVSEMILDENKKVATTRKGITVTNIIAASKSNDNKRSTVKFTTSKSDSYVVRTSKNAEDTDITLALVVNSTTAGETLTAQQAGSKDKKYLGTRPALLNRKDKYVPVSINGVNVEDCVKEIINTINSKNLPTSNIKLNIAGNGIYSFKNFTQEQLNNYVTEVLQQLRKAGITISSIRSGGQTGVDEAGIIAAQRLGIPAEVHTTADWKFRDKNGRDISNEEAFKARFNIQQVDTTQQSNVFNDAITLMDRIIKESNERVEFVDTKENPHTYFIKEGNNKVKAKWSVTGVKKELNTNINDKPFESQYDYLTPSSAIGNTFDKFTRLFFQARNEGKYTFEDFNKAYGKDIQNLTNDQKTTTYIKLQSIVDNFDKVYGKNGWRVYTDEFALAVKTKLNNEEGYLAGTPDMVLIDSNGNFHIYDMKTRRRNNIQQSNSSWETIKIPSYSTQVETYKTLLETNYPELKGKITADGLIVCDVEYFVNKNTQYKITNAGLTLNGTVINEVENGLNIGSITLQNTQKVTLNKEVVKEFRALSSEDKSIIKEQFGNVYEEVEETPSIEDTMTEVPEVQSIYNTGLLQADEIKFLANSIMLKTSYIISHLQTSPKAKEYYGFGYIEKDLTKLDRLDIIKEVGLQNIFNFIKRRTFDPFNYEDDAIFNKVQVCYDHFKELCNIGYSKLISLEGITITEVTPEDIKSEDASTDLESTMDSGVLEEKEREAYQIQLKQLSVKNNLSILIKRAFEKLLVVDENNNVVSDEYGYGFNTYVDPTEAVQSILTWCRDCTTFEEMQDVFNKRKEQYPWINSINKLLENETFRAQFFQNFRKDFTIYSIVYEEEDYNATTNTRTTTFKVKEINTLGAYQALEDSLSSKYNNGLMQNIIITKQGELEGKGRVNTKYVQQLHRKFVDNVLNQFRNIDLNNVSYNDKITKNVVDNLFDVLHALGVDVDIKSLITYISDKKRPQVNKFTNAIKYIFADLQEAADKKLIDYNPLSKGDYNCFSNFKTILTELAPYVQSSIESSSYENGKMYYSFITPSYMGKLVRNLKDSLQNQNKFNKFIDENYASYKFFKDPDTSNDLRSGWNNYWLERIVNDSVVRNNLNHKVQLSFNKTDYSNLSELGYTLSLMSEYFYDSKNKKYAWYRLPILSNKPSSEFIKFERITNESIPGKSFKEIISLQTYKTFLQELMRMRTVLERLANNEISEIKSFDVPKGKLLKLLGEQKYKSLIKKINNKTLTFKDLIINGTYIFDNSKFTSGVAFKFLPAFNADLLNGNSSLNKGLINALNGDFTSISEKDFTNAFTSYMDVRFQNELTQWKSVGVFDTTLINMRDASKKSVTVHKYINGAKLNLINLGDIRKEIIENQNLSGQDFINAVQEAEERALTNALEEYMWNDMFATTQIIELTATDLAYYKNVEDFQKRYAQVHSPSLRLDTDATWNSSRVSDGTERTMYIKDSVVKSDIITNVTKVFDDKINSIADENTKESYKQIKSMVLSALEEVNVADAQGYSSPTSYRKKMIMCGKWSNEMENAYNKILNGEFDLASFNIVWQPLKPFVYSQIHKNSGAATMSELKVPIQNKNSEYLLIIADALMRGGNQVNRLSAIYKFMEDSAKNNPTRGIDTIQFNSAVKSGEMGVIDINNETSEGAIINKLNKAAFISNGVYNDQYVHEIPYEDYGLQQEVPAHFTDHEQLMGSQMRILSISDLEGSEYKVGNESLSSQQLRDEYCDLIAQNIRSSYDVLCKDLHLIKKPNESIATFNKRKNKAISDLLVDAIKKDQRYGADLLRSCSINPKTSEFNIPLSDPIQATRIQQLLNSIIKSRINKQTVKGGPVVQASVYGLSNDLHIKFKDKNGKILLTEDEFNTKYPNGSKLYKNYRSYIDTNQDGIAYFECYMPIPSESVRKAMTKKDGTIMTLDEAKSKGFITEEMCKAIGYRIPTEDKYSMAPLKIVGFLPKEAGEAVMLPKEITTLSGSDFDIDKMYIMLKAFSVDKEFLNSTQASQDFFKYLEDKKYSKDTINSFKFGNSNNLEDSFNTLYESVLNGFTPNKNSAHNRIFLDWFEKNQNNLVKYKEITGTDTKEGRNNRIFDLQWSVLTNRDTLDKLFNPGSFDIQKKSAKIINTLNNMSTNPTIREVVAKGMKEKNIKSVYEYLSTLSNDELTALADTNSGRDICLSSTQVYFHKQNMTAGKLIGVFANNNTSHSFLSMQDITLNLSKNLRFQFNGYKFIEDNIISEENGREIINIAKVDKINALDGTRISKTIASFLAASVDAVKDPVLNFMNLNTLTANPAMLLARMGFDSDSIGLLMTQPKIVELTREYFKRSNEGYVDINSLINEFLKGSEVSEENFEEAYTFTKDELCDGILSEDNRFQDACLILFKRLNTIAQQLNTLTFLTKYNSVTNAVGPNISDTLVMEQRKKDFEDIIGTNECVFNDEAGNVIENNPILKAFYDTTVGERGASKLIFGDYFIQYSSIFEQLLSYLRSNIKSSLRSDVIETLISDFIYYNLTSGTDAPIDGSFDSRKYYVSPDGFISDYFKDSEELKSNKLINCIELVSKTSKCPVPTLTAKTGGMSIDSQEEIKAAWSVLVNNPNEKIRNLGLKLFKYNIIRSGFKFSPKTFLHLASVDVKKEANNATGYLDIINHIFRITDPNNDEIRNFLVQFFRNHCEDKRIFNLIPVLKSGKHKVEGNQLTIVTDGITEEESKEIKSQIKINDNFVPFITYQNKLYVLEGYNTYTELSKLGNANNFIEYDANTDGIEMESALTNISNTIQPITDDGEESDDRVILEEDITTINYQRIDDGIIDEALNAFFNTDEKKEILSKYSKSSNKRKAYIDEVMKRANELGSLKTNKQTMIIKDINWCKAK